MSTVSIERYTMPSAVLGKPSPLPDLQRNRDAHTQINVDLQTVTSEEARYMGWGNVNGILPYTIRNHYGRTRKMRSWKAIVLENDHIRATFLPELGARLWSLIDKHTGKELLHCNPVFQPCNLALRNAWISGGVEWNLGIIGHTPFTVDSLYAETLTLSDGTPVVRFYQYERVRHLLYRVEAALPDDARHLYVRVRIDNPSDQDSVVYWWSNIAVDEREDVRVLVPADRAFQYGYTDLMSKVEIPYVQEWKDVSYTTNLPYAMDFFFDIPEGQRRWIAVLDGNGYGFCQSSTALLQGRKLFVWGMGAGGRHWQEFLSQPGSAYIEIQAGLAHTQLEHLPMPGGKTLSWLETYGSMQADPGIVHGKDWYAATGAVDEQIEKIISSKDLSAMHERMAGELDDRNGKLIHQADGWGYLESEICGGDFRGGCLRFPKARIGAAEQEWLTLLKTGALPCLDAMDPPKGYQVNDRWFDLLAKSVASENGNHWYAQYQLGVMLAYRNDHAGAKAAFERSLAMQRSPWALRCLAVLAYQQGDLNTAGNRMLEALAMCTHQDIVIETLDILCEAGRYAEAEQAFKAMPKNIRRIARIKLLRIRALLGLGNAKEAERMLMHHVELIDVREGELSLTHLWFHLCALKKTQECGGMVTDELIAEMSRTCTPPAHLDFRMH